MALSTQSASIGADWLPVPAPADMANPSAGWWLSILERALISRAMDDLEVTKEYRPNPDKPLEGKLKFQFGAKGHEVPQLIAAALLNHPHDAATVYYRSRPLMLGVGLSPWEAFASNMHKVEGVSGGRDIGVVFNHKQPGGVTVLPASGDVGAQFTPAVGWAQAVRYRVEVMGQQEYDGAVALVHAGDGATSTNGFWSAINIAGPRKLPYVMLIEDNRYALSVPWRYQSAATSVVENLANFQGLNIQSVEGGDIVELYNALHSAISSARQGGGAQLVHVKVPRLTGHNWQDPAAYKTPEEKEEDLRRDPIARLTAYLQQEHGVPEGKIEEMRQEAEGFARQQAEAAWSQGTEPQVGDGLKHLFAPARTSASTTPITEGPRLTMQQAIKQALADEMAHDASVVVFGEDVGAFGGVHRVTEGLQAKYGEARCFDTSLNEEGIIGRAVGMSMNGLRPVPEIQFRKYADPAHEQITDAGSLRWRTNGRFGGPMVMRIPVGYQVMGGDPWHAVCGEAVFAHLPGWQIAYPATAADAVGLLRTALRGDNPVVFLEHRLLYRYREANAPYPGPDYEVPFGKARIARQGSDALIVTWGDTVYRSIEAANAVAGATGAEARVLDLRTIVPWDKEAVLAAVRETGRVLIVHEDTITCGFGAENAAQVAEEAFMYLDAPVKRVAMEDVPSPTHHNLFEEVMPTSRKIQKALEELLRF
ncbi:MAG TPA: thiamine pyrophosphate-dependent enzyme, partial [Chloroflexia bacterium]|nr:thiamine pyrophosphate-dependent enzyme [Chloroflexia bacterium]